MRKSDLVLNKSQDRDDVVRQFISGENNYVGGRDLIQQQFVVNEGCLLTFVSEVELDEKSIECPHLFYRRFGFFASPPARKKLIELKCSGDNTEFDFQRLHRQGVLKAKDDKLVFRSHKFDFFAGWLLQIFAAISACIYLIPIIMLSKNLDFRIQLACLYFLAILAITCYFVQRWIFWPRAIVVGLLKEKAKNQRWGLGSGRILV